MITWTLPLLKMVKIILTMTYFGPLVSVSSLYAKRLGYEKEVVAESTTISILLSILISSFILSM